MGQNLTDNLNNAMSKNTLSTEDVQRLLADPSGEVRADTAAKIATGFGEDDLSDSERQLAEEIFRMMVKDAEVRVREALSQNLKENPMVPHDVAKILAEDVNEVALPMLEFSDVLTDEDLIKIIRSQGGASKQIAIASRGNVSETISEALVETNNEEVVTTLVSNEGAEISETSLQKVVDNFGENEAVQAAMIERPKLPLTVSERLVTMVSDQMQEKLAQRQELSLDMATDLILQSRERATINLSSDGGQDELEAMIRQLHDSGRLTPSIVMRALCMGDLNFFESSMAELAGIPIINVRQLIHDTGPLGLKAVYEKAGLPEAQYTAARAAVDVVRETDYDGEPNDRERYSRRIIERILTQYGDLGVEFESDDLEYLLAKMGDLPADIKVNEK